jgi:CheY-like chemotaxis protein
VLSAARSEQSASIRIALTDETGRRAAERTALQAQKMEAIGRMAGGIAHDLNNLLTVVSVHDDFLLTALPTDDPKREDLLAIQAALRKAAALTTKLLSFARPQVLDCRRICLNGLVDDFALTIRRELPDGVDLITELAVPPVEVEIDPAQLEQVLRHLVRNAEEAMPDGGLITIRTTSCDVAESQLVGHPGVRPGWFGCLQVSDTGIGMDPPTLSHAFEPYFTTKPRGESHGLGLATVYAVARQNGGFVTAESIQGDGTTISVYLPEAELVEPPSISAPTPDAVMGTETILIAEDEPAIRNVIHRMLSKQGYQCHMADDGEDALRQLDALGGKVDLLLSDVVMPNCTGPELVQRMRERYPRIPVVFMTGYASSDEVEEAPLPNVFGVLHKPFALHALQKIVRQAIDGA